MGIIMCFQKLLKSTRSFFMFRSYTAHAAVLIAAIFFPSALFADNFFIPYHPTSDPAPSVFTYNGMTKVYVYCTQDMIGSSGSVVYPIDTIHCYSSSDMYHWKDEGVALDEQHCPSWVYHGGHQLWAPTVVYLKGLYRLYAPEATTTAGDASAWCFMSTSTTPMGPFTPAPTYFSATGIGAIDPYVFCDTTDSVRVYMIYRNHSPERNYMIRMNDSGSATVGTPWQITGLENQYQEGSWLYKYNGYYYLMYATKPASTNEIISYATAPVPAKGGITSATAWTMRGQISGPTSDFTIHAGACLYAVPGTTTPQWYFFWSGVDEIGPKLFNAGHSRCTAIESLTYTAGTPALISPLGKTYRGVGVASAAIDSIQVDRYTSSSGIGLSVFAYGVTTTEAMGWYVSNITNNSSVQYNNVDFTPSAGYAIGTVQARVATTNATNTIQVRLGSITGTLLGTIAVPNTGSLTTWTTTASLTLSMRPPAGVQNLVLVFGAGTANTMNVNWVKFGQVLVSGVNSNSDRFSSTALTYTRINKNTFSVNVPNGSVVSDIRFFNLTGQEIVNALRTSLAGTNLTVSLHDGILASGSYLLEIKSGKEELRIRFTY